MRRRLVWTALTLVLALFYAFPGRARAAEPMEFIRVSSDGWNFETAHSHKRFIPFGGSMIFAYQGSSTDSTLGILSQPTWDPVTIRKFFEGAHAANLNLLKVFIFTLGVVPDPQTNDKITFKTMTPPFLDRLDQLFQIARETGVYISLCSAEWGIGWTSWFLDGGNFFGRNPAEGVDSWTVYRNFWTTLANRYKNEPALFSYNLAVEFYMPGSNWRANILDLNDKGEDKGTYWYMFNETWGTSRWRTWVTEQYGTIDKLNSAWGSSYTAFNKFPQPDIVWKAPAYTRPQRMIGDYNSFKEWVSYRFLKNQADAIRAVDRGHMITAGLHPAHPATCWAGAAVNLSGIPAKELDFLDYETLHVYTQPDDQKPGQGPFTFALHGVLFAARFSYHPGKPLIAEEIGHIVPDYNESLSETINIVNTLVGHVSGFQLWLTSEAVDKLGQQYGPMDQNYQLNDWGREWKKLAEPGGAVYNLPRARTPAGTTFKLDRVNAMCPIKDSPNMAVLWNWNSYKQPVDFDLPLNPAIAKIRPVPVHTGVMPPRWAQY